MKTRTLTEKELKLLKKLQLETKTETTVKKRWTATEECAADIAFAFNSWWTYFIGAAMAAVFFLNLFFPEIAVLARLKAFDVFLAWVAGIFFIIYSVEITNLAEEDPLGHFPIMNWCKKYPYRKLRRFLNRVLGFLIAAGLLCAGNIITTIFLLVAIAVVYNARYRARRATEKAVAAIK